MRSSVSRLAAEHPFRPPVVRVESSLRTTHGMIDAATDILEWDVENWSEALEFWRRYSSQTLAGCKALEIGSRNGGLSLWLALCGARVVCSDLDGPTDVARHKHQQYGVADAVTYEAVNALDIPYRETFDIVVFKS